MKHAILRTLLILIATVPAAWSQTAGLWIGQVSLDGVSDARAPAGSPVLFPTGGGIGMRILLHVDEAGAVTLLKDVIVMRRGATNGEPARFVLLTDPALIPDFDGVIERKGKFAGLRYSSVAYAFDGTKLALAGALATGGSLSGTLSLAADDPANPYRHKFHPDHREGFAIGRSFAITFAFGAPNPGTDPPGFGTEWISGSYLETVTGLHRKPITIGGDIRLTKVSDVGVLNDGLPAN